MAIDTGALYYLVDPFVQWENVNGKPIVGGHVEVYEAGTDNKVITYQNWDGTRHPFKIPLGSDGRACILVDPGYSYDAYVYDSFNNLVCSRLNIIPLSDGDIHIEGMGQVYHDETLSGKGTPNSPLTVVSGGKVYGGIYPIDVNNELDMISADNVPLGVQEPLYFAQDDDEGLVIALSSVPVPEGTMNESAFGYQDGQITSYNGSAFSAGNSYEAGSYVDITNNTISVVNLPTSADVQNIVDVATSGLMPSGDYLTKESADTLYAPTGNYLTGLPEDLVYSADITGFATTAQLDEKLDKADSANFYPMDSNPSGYLTTHQDLSDYAKTEDLTAYQEKGNYYSASNPSGFINSDAISAMATTGFVAGVSADITALIPSTAGLATEDWVTGQGYLTAHQSLDGLMSASLLEFSDDKITGYNGTAFAGTTVSGDFTLVEGNGIQLTDDPVAQTTTISVSGDYAYNSAVSSKLDTTAFSTVSGTFLTGLPTDVAYTGWVESSIVSATSGLQPSGLYLSFNDLRYIEV